MEIIRTVSRLSEAVDAARAKGCSIGLVPTMGALHAGHRSLVERARAENDIVVVSVFVNPTQFNNADDLRTYPRTEEADTALLEACGVDYAFIPSVSEIYPEPDTRVFDLGPVAEVMEGAMRPGHFNGVAQIVSKLFALAKPTRAYFGEKDFQQIAVIRRMVELEGFDLEIVPCPIVREADGLAGSGAPSSTPGTIWQWISVPKQSLAGVFDFLLKKLNIEYMVRVDGGVVFLQE